MRMTKQDVLSTANHSFILKPSLPINVKTLSKKQNLKCYLLPKKIIF